MYAHEIYNIKISCPDFLKLVTSYSLCHFERSEKSTERGDVSFLNITERDKKSQEDFIERCKTKL